MAENVDAETLQAVFEWNACCKGGAREKASKAFAKENARLSIDERLQKIKDVPYMGQPVRNEDGTITVHAVYCSNGERFFAPVRISTIRNAILPCQSNTASAVQGISGIIMR